MRACTCTVAPPGCRVSVVTRREPSPGIARCSNAVSMASGSTCAAAAFTSAARSVAPLGRVLPDVPAVRHGHVGARHHHRAVAGEVRVEPVRLAAEPGRRDVGVRVRAVRPGEQRPEVQVVAVDEELRHRRRSSSRPRPACGPASGSAARHAVPRPSSSDPPASAPPGSAPAPGTWCDPMSTALRMPCVKYTLCRRPFFQ